MKPTDMTVHILREIRDELKTVREEMKTMREQSDERFELIESTLLGTNQHLMTMSRSLRALLSARGDTDVRLEDHEARLLKLEKRKSH